MIQLKIQPKIKKSADKTSNHISIGVNKGVDIGVNCNNRESHQAISRIPLSRVFLPELFCAVSHFEF
jgi:hypothetical protein